MNTIEKILNQRQLDLSNQFASYKKDETGLDSILASLEPLALSVAFPDSLDFSFAGDKELLNSVWHELRAHGWKSDFPPPEPKMTTWSGFWRHDDYDTRIWITFSSTVCKRVQVGTQLVEQPVYEVVCDES